MLLRSAAFVALLLLCGCAPKPTLYVDAQEPGTTGFTAMNERLQTRPSEIVLADGTRHLGRDAVVSADSVLWNDFTTGAPQSAATPAVLQIETTGFRRPLYGRRSFWLGLMGTVAIVQARAAIWGEHGGDHGVDPVDISLTLAGGTVVGMGTAWMWERIDSDGTVGRYVLRPTP